MTREEFKSHYYRLLPTAREKFVQDCLSYIWEQRELQRINGLFHESLPDPDKYQSWEDLEKNTWAQDMKTKIPADDGFLPS